MNGPSRLLVMSLAVTALAGGQTRRLPAGDVARGREILFRQKCVFCHGEGADGRGKAAGLLRTRGRGYSPFMLAGELWNHAPGMWREMGKLGIPIPRLDRQQASDLFAFFFAAQYFEMPGDARRGRQVFRTTSCGGCHGIASPVRDGIAAVNEWDSLDDVIDLARLAWKHGRETTNGLRPLVITAGLLTSQDMRDLVAYLHGRTGRKTARQAAPPAVEGTGEKLFEVKGCANCHQGSRALARRPTRYGLTEFAAAMWRHPLQVPEAAASISATEMRRLVEYLVAAQFFEERGDRDRGERVFAAKGCASCHAGEGSAGPDLAIRRRRMTSYDMVAALWQHGPRMQEEMQRRHLAWPLFKGKEMADLAAYIHGPEFAPRPK